MKDGNFFFDQMLREKKGLCFGGADRLCRCTFDRDNGAVPKLQKLRSYAENWQQMERENVGLFLWGDTGSGKTFAAACVANYLIEQQTQWNFDARMLTLGSFLTQLLAKSPQEKEQYLLQLQNCSLLILDDLGMERHTEYAMEQIFNIIDGRYLAARPLIVTTNLTLTELKNPGSLAEKRIYDRILEVCVPVCFDCENQRRGIAKEKMELFRELTA